MWLALDVQASNRNKTKFSTGISGRPITWLLLMVWLFQPIFKIIRPKKKKKDTISEWVPWWKQSWKTNSSMFLWPCHWHSLERSDLQYKNNTHQPCCFFGSVTAARSPERECYNRAERVPCPVLLGLSFQLLLLIHNQWQWELTHETF